MLNLFVLSSWGEPADVQHVPATDDRFASAGASWAPRAPDAGADGLRLGADLRAELHPQGVFPVAESADEGAGGGREPGRKRLRRPEQLRARACLRPDAPMPLLRA